MGNRRGSVLEALKKLAWELKDLDLGDEVSVHKGQITPLQFHQKYVSPNKPVILKGNWPALKNWSPEYLRNKVGSKTVGVQITPNGRADAVTATVDEDGNRISYFAEPCREEMTFSNFLDFLRQSRTCSPPEVPYMQQQNNNLREELPELCEDIGQDGPQWATDAFGCAPEAVNLWIGDERSVTSFHKDHYENIYVVLRGTKVFTLLPPSAAFRMHVKKYRVAKYERNQHGVLELVPSAQTSALVPWSPIEMATSLSDGIGLRTAGEEKWPDFVADELPPPIQCSVTEGDVLYLPSLWYHHVEQVSRNHGCVIAVNFWYDMQFDIKYAYHKFVEHLSEDCCSNAEEPRETSVQCDK